MLRFLNVILAGLMCLSTASAKEIYVDNIIGHDTADGMLPFIGDSYGGPLATIHRAVELAEGGDVIIVKNNGIPYYESISLMGSRNSGTVTFPFVIDGGGATVSGLRKVVRAGWQEVAPRVWKLTLTRKGYCQLFRNGKSLTEYRPEAGANGIATLPPGQWVSWQGSLYFRQDSVMPPTEEEFAYTADQTGLSLHSVENVVITNLRLQHFRFDGLHAQGICRSVTLDNVDAIQNGRAGIASTGASRLHIVGGQFIHNGRVDVLVDAFSKAIRVDAPAPNVEENTEK